MAHPDSIAESHLRSAVFEVTGNNAEGRTGQNIGSDGDATAVDDVVGNPKLLYHNLTAHIIGLFDGGSHHGHEPPHHGDRAPATTSTIPPAV
jgi:hypothetical protein